MSASNTTSPTPLKGTANEYQPAKPSLDFLSEEFDPEEALRSPLTVVPYPRVKPLNNLSECYKVLFARRAPNQRASAGPSQASFRASSLPTQHTSSEPAMPPKSNLTTQGTMTMSNPASANAETGPDAPNKHLPSSSTVFRPVKRPAEEEASNQLPPAKRKKKTVLTRMEDAEGPLSLLKKMMDEKRRARIVIRARKGVHGVCIGFIQAFDKHFNIVLSDVTETYKTSSYKLRKDVRDCAHLINGTRRQRRRAYRPVLIKTEKVRLLDQILIRGENVVLVSDYEQDKR